MTVRQGTVMWITGLPASGKTTLARALVAELREQGIPTLWLDSDDLREVLTPRATFSEGDRDLFYAALAHLARRAAEGDVTVVVSATVAKRAYRDRVRRLVPQFVEIWLSAPRGALELRDPKGLYAAARRGEVIALPGVGVPYEPPEAAEIVVDTERHDAGETLTLVMEQLAHR